MSPLAIISTFLATVLFPLILTVDVQLTDTTYTIFDNLTAEIVSFRTKQAPRTSSKFCRAYGENANVETSQRALTYRCLFIPPLPSPLPPSPIFSFPPPINPFPPSTGLGRALEDGVGVGVGRDSLSGCCPNDGIKPDSRERPLGTILNARYDSREEMRKEKAERLDRGALNEC